MPAIIVESPSDRYKPADAMESEEPETPSRVKFLCSFGGSILPRPLDGKLRYVGGETRIVCVPRDICYDELMSRLQELFDGGPVAVVKYQQPDEDLDALVSVVNDDDVMNMMEEYDKVGAGDGFTRLRIFLFSHPDHDVVSLSPHFVDSDERETERRYVDALNSLNDTVPEFRNLHLELDKIHVGEQFYNPMSSVEMGSSLHTQRNSEIGLPQFNLHHIAVPPHAHSHTTRYNEMESPRNPGYYSPGRQPSHIALGCPEFPPSPSTGPSTGRCGMPFGDLHDKSMDRMAEEYGRQPAFVDNVVWVPPGGIVNGKTGFPASLSHTHNAFKGNNSVCEHCHMAFQRNQALLEARYPDSRWRHGQPHMEQSSAGNEFNQFPNWCAECLPGHESCILNPDKNLEHGMYSKEQNENPPLYNESHNQERGWVLQHHQMDHRAEEARTHLSGVRGSEHYMADGGMNANFPFAHDRHSLLPSNCLNHDNSWYTHAGAELGNEGFHKQIVGPGQIMHVPPIEDCAIQYGNLPPAYGMDNHYQAPHGSTLVHPVWRKVQNPMLGGPSHEASVLLPQANGTVNSGFLKGQGSPRFSRVGVEDQNPWGGHYCGPPQKILGFNGPAAPGYHQDHSVNPHSNIPIQEKQQLFALDPVPLQSGVLEISVPPQVATLMSHPSTCIDDKLANSAISGYHPSPTSDTVVTTEVKLADENKRFGEALEEKHVEAVNEPDVKNVSSLKGYQEREFDSNGAWFAAEDGNTRKLSDAGPHGAVEQGELEDQCLSFLPELIASVKRAALEGAEVKAAMQGNDNVSTDIKESPGHELEHVNANNELEHDSGSDDLNISKIEPTKAEEDAFDRGLQTIKNDDLEEVRELGSGTYGAVYHGKWKGSDVAIKRIKASCFSGRPSERERLIADFWKEALILSSLHHPNVVSFYGIVRDGPDGSLATLTEFMVNGSLKQFLQKKDRTIDRRKRLIIAMDAAFGMEYLHGKDIVHFDLKCENLLVNMRDPHRPVCKIGDLGLSKLKQHTLVSGGVRGTLPWMAPELLSGKTTMVTEKIDVYSFGIVMWELLTGEEPYPDMHCASIIGGIVNNTLRPRVPTWCDPEWRSLMERCWSSEPSERPSFSEISQKLRTMAAAMNLK